MIKPKFIKGDYINERYLVKQALQGGMGEVYISLDIALDQLVALKTFQLRHTQQLADMFISEAKTWILLERHKHIVQAKTVFSIDQQPFIVIEYVDGGDLRSKLRGGAIDLRVAMELAIQFCSGANYAYRKLKLIHRDIKPENLLLTDHGVLKITDFGLSKIASDSLIEPSGIVGTPPYMSPEQWTSAEVTIQSDIYAFGVVMYEMLTGTWPFRATSIDAFRRAHEEAFPPEPHEINNSIPQDLGTIIMKCLEKNPVKRFYSYDALIEAVGSVYQQVFGINYTFKLGEEEKEIPTSTTELLVMGDSLVDIRRYSEALSYYDKFIDMEPFSSLPWQRKGDTLSRMGKHHEALLYLNKALEFESSNLQAVKGKIRCLIGIDKPQDALLVCNETLHTNPNDKDLLKFKRALIQEQTLIVEKQQPSNSGQTSSSLSPLQETAIAKDLLTPYSTLSEERNLASNLSQAAVRPQDISYEQRAKNQAEFDRLWQEFKEAMAKHGIELEVNDSVREMLCSPEMADARDNTSITSAFIVLIEIPLNRQFSEQRLLPGDRVRVSCNENHIEFTRQESDDEGNQWVSNN